MAARTPNLKTQRDAMEKLAFLVGKWTGEAQLLRGATELVELIQTEEAQYRLDGLILTIEGVGRDVTGGQTFLQAFGIISYDDDSGMYSLRAFNDGRYLETEVKLLEQGKSIIWGFALGEIKTKSVLRINERGEWTEVAEITVGSQAPKKLMQLTARPQK
jgi:hypothetical protein